MKKQQLDEFASGQKHSQFLQSACWGDFQEKECAVVYRWGILKDGKIVQAIQFFEKKLPFGICYFYAPRIGIKNLKNDELIFLINNIKKTAKDRGAVLFRFDPRNDQSDVKQLIKIKKTIDVQPSKTTILDIGKTEEELLKAMHQKTRYNIRLAERKGVVVNRVGLDRFEDFWHLMEQTVNRDGFRLHNRKYYQDMLECGTGLLTLFFAEHNGKVLAANIVAEFGDMATYVHGASSNEHRNLMAPFLLQWSVIKEMKTKGYKYYDLYGVDEEKWPGVTRFKRGFGGEEIIYPGTFDIIFDPTKYTIYKLARAIRRKIKI